MQDWSELIERLEERRIRKFLQNPFSQPNETLSFLQSVVALKRKQLPRRVRRLLDEQVLPKLRRKAASLEPEAYWRFIGVMAKAEDKMISLLPELFGRAENPEQAVSICRLLLRSAIRYLFRFQQNADITEKQSQLLLVAICLLLVGAAHYPTWETFLRQALTKPEAEAVLFHWYQFFNQMTAGGLILFPVSKLPPLRTFTVADAISFVLGKDENVVIPIPDDLMLFLPQVFDRFRRQIDESQQEELRFLFWFQENRSWFEAAWSKMWDEVSVSRQYGLRSGGLDNIKIGIEALKASDWRFTQVQYCQETVSPSSVTVRLWWEFVDEVSTFEWALKPARLGNPWGNSLPKGDPREVLDAVLAYISLHGYWRIVTAKKNPLPTKPPTGVRPKGAELPKEWTAVRWHWRRIDGQASEQARAAALRIADLLPSTGQTFVRPHIRGIAKLHSTEPLFTYREADIGYPG